MGTTSQTRIALAVFMLNVVLIGSTNCVAAPCPTPSFDPPREHGTWPFPQQIAVGDFDSDGKLDLIVPHEEGWTLYTGDGTGRFSELITYTDNFGRNRVASIGDFDADGNLDVVLAADDGTVTTLWLELGSGSWHFRLAEYLELPWSAPSAITTGDFNRDGHLDIAIASFQGDELHIFVGDGQGKLRFHESFSTGRGPVSLVAADFDDDGALDIATANLNDNTVTVKLNPGINGFGGRRTIDVGMKPLSIAVGDFNRDGNVDLVTANNGAHDAATHTVSVLIGDGAGGFRSVLNYPSRSGAESVAVADVNQDGNPDLVVSSVAAIGNAVSVLLGNGTGAFGPPTVVHSPNEWPMFVTTGNFNGDGGPDLAVAYRYNGFITTHINACAGPPVDLAATAIEVTQAIQDLQNSVPLIAGKRTFARVHVSANVAVEGVAARLYGYDNSGKALPSSPLKPANRTKYGASIDVKSTPDRAALNDSFYFELPFEWIQLGTIHLRAEINHLQTISESDVSNNVMDSGPLTFGESKALQVRLVGYSYIYNGKRVAPTDRDLDAAESRWRRELPVRGLDSRRSLVLDNCREADSCQYTWGESRIPANTQLLALLDSLRLRSEGVQPVGSESIYYLLYASPEGVRLDTADGAAQWVYRIAVSRTGSPPYTGEVAAHEMLHLFARFHVYSADPDCEIPDQIDSNYPYSEGRIGGEAGQEDRFCGFDAGDLAIGAATRVIPSTAFEIMTYCPRPKWISDYNYRKALNYILNAPGVGASRLDAFGIGLESQSGTDSHLSVFGVIDLASDLASFVHLSREPQAGNIPTSVPGPYHIQLFDEAGSLLADYPFTPQELSDSDATALIVQVVPFLSGTRRVSIYSEVAGREIGFAEISASEPIVAITSSHAGATLAADEPVTVNWSGSDADGDALMYHLLYSRDGGATWRVVATRIRDSHYSIASSFLEGTGGLATGFFRIVAHDGVLTASADEGPFTVTGKAPSVRIISPAHLSAYEYGQTIALEAVGQDLEDGTLPDRSLGWNSDLDGPLGNGHLLHASRLSPGTQTITVVATDSDGQTDSASVVVHIGYQNPLITCPPDQVVRPDPGKCSAVVSWPPPTITDNLPGATVTCTPPSGSVLPLGESTVTCVATDTDGNVAGCSFTVTVEPGNKCPRSQGHWKNNPTAWPVGALVVGNKTYTKAELLKLLNTAVGTDKKADASLILVQQLIPAILNTGNGGDPSPVCQIIEHAHQLLRAFSGKLPYAVKPSSPAGKLMVSAARALENYNVGLVTSGCEP